MDTKRKAMSYIGKVREALHENEQDVQEQAFQLFRDSRSGKFKPKEVADRAKELFKGHKDLLDGFNFFLPPNCKIDINEEDDTAEPIELEDEADNLIKMVRERHADKYEEFLKSLVMYTKGKKDIIQTCNEVTCILSDSPDLLEIFNKFLEPSELYKRYGDQVTPNYKLLLVKPSQSSHVLNNTCASIAIKEFRAKPLPLPLSRYEQCVEDVEEERFHADRERKMLESVLSMVKDWLKENDRRIIDKDERVDLKKHFLPIYLTYMKNACRSYSLNLEVENMAMKHALRTLELMIKKLERKQVNLEKNQSRLKQKWAEKLAKERARASKVK